MEFPGQFQEGYSLSRNCNWAHFKGFRPRQIYFAGMGGSGLSADLLNACSNTPGLVLPIRDYSLPSSASQKDLVIAASYSGNTEEILSVYREAREKKIPSLVMAHGGELQDSARHDEVPLISIPKCLQPRCAMGYFFSAGLGVLETFGFISSPKNEIEELANFLREQQATHHSLGRELAKQIGQRVPIIYGPTYLEGACRIWKIKFNENCKIQSFYNVFPELNHNEMAGFNQLKMDPYFVYLIGPLTHPRVLKHMDLFQSTFGDRSPFFRVPLSGTTRIQEIFDSLGFADFTTYHLAHSHGIDPAPVAMVEDFKKKLAN